jgi:hypothetical protein
LAGAGGALGDGGGGVEGGGGVVVSETDGGVEIGAVDDDEPDDELSWPVAPTPLCRAASVRGWAQLAHQRASTRLAVPHCGQRTGRSSVIGLLYGIGSLLEPGEATRALPVPGVSDTVTGP